MYYRPLASVDGGRLVSMLVKAVCCRLLSEVMYNAIVVVETVVIAFLCVDVSKALAADG